MTLTTKAIFSTKISTFAVTETTRNFNLTNESTKVTLISSTSPLPTFSSTKSSSSASELLTISYNPLKVEINLEIVAYVLIGLISLVLISVISFSIYLTRRKRFDPPEIDFMLKENIS